MDWYEELDYEENPFKDNEDTELIGYEDVVDEVLYRLASGSMVCVEGKSGAGKTAILKAVLNKFRDSGKVVYLNGQQLSNGLNIEEVLNKKAGLVKRLFNKKPKNMILLLDEVQGLSRKNCERIKYYFDNNFIKSAVFTSSDFKEANFTESLKERVSKTIRLRELTEDEAVDIVQSRLGSDEIIPEEVIKEVFSRSDRNMKSFLKSCEQLCAFAFENNGKKVLPEHVKEVFGEEPEDPEMDCEVEEPEANKKIIQKTKGAKKKSECDKAKPKSSGSKAAKKEETKETTKDPRLAVEEPVKVTIVDDFKPEKKEVKMEDEPQDEEIDIDDELKKLSKAKSEDDEELGTEDYEDDYDDFQDSDDEEEEESKETEEGDEDVAEKYY